MNLANTCGVKRHETEAGAGKNCRFRMKKHIDRLDEESGSYVRVSFRSEAEAARAAVTTPEIRGPILKDGFRGGVISPRNMRRSNAVYGIPIDKLHSPDYVIEPDEKFVQLFARFLAGRANAYSTRIPSEDIMDGFCTAAPACERKYENTPEDDIERNCRAIRAGERLSIWVRENDSCASAPRFFHTDGIAVLKAYRKLGIVDIPVTILAESPPKDLPHSAYVVGHGGPLKDTVARVEDFLICEVKTVPALASVGTPLIEVLSRAKSRLRGVIESLIAFHCDSDENDIVHYHDSLYSLLIRAEEHVLALDLLVERKLWSAIPNLQRSLYELCLTCYVDWVAPRQIYHDLSVSASLDGAGLKFLEEQLVKDYSQRGSPQRAKVLAKRTLKLVRWLEKVSNKASFAPIGIALHKKIYSALSSTAHQDFSQTARHANRFRNPSFEHFGERSQRSLADFLSIVVGDIVVMAEGDISCESSSS